MMIFYRVVYVLVILLALSPALFLLGVLIYLLTYL